MKMEDHHQENDADDSSWFFLFNHDIWFDRTWIAASTSRFNWDRPHVKESKSLIVKTIVISLIKW